METKGDSSVAGSLTDELLRELARAPSELVPTTTINGRYEIARVLGRGGMGVVYEVNDGLRPGSRVALKTMAGGSVSAERVALFKAEFDALARLRHPNVAEVYDFERVDGGGDHFFTMELVTGRSILDATAGAGWPDVVDALVQVCRALTYLHSRDVLHLDLKPDNVLVDAKGAVKVLDFGLAGWPSLAGARGPAGTRGYIAPERLEGGAVDVRADLFSVGVMAHQLLRGAAAPEWPPRFDEPSLAHVPGWLRAVIERACARDPAERFRAASDMIAEIGRGSGRSQELETAETRDSYLFSSRFIGRDDELARLRAFVERRLAGDPTSRSPTAVYVAGPGGMGKSRLLDELRRTVQLEGLLYIEGADAPELLERLFRVAASAGQEELLARHHGALRRLSPGLPAQDAARLAEHTPLPDPATEHLRTLEDVTDFLVRLAESSPFVLAVRDLHRAKRATVELLAHLAWRIASGDAAGSFPRVAVVGDLRDDELEGRPVNALLELPRDARPELVRLGPLDAASVVALIRSMFGIAPPDAFSARVVAETGGVPFFVEEIARVLVENGTVFIQDGRWTARHDIDAIPLPATVRATLLERVALLEPAAREALQLLAVCERPASMAVLREALGWSFEELREALRPLEQRGMANASESTTGREPTFGIAAGRMAEVLYETMAEEVRVGLHRRLAGAIERLHADGLERHVRDLAHHHWHAGDKARALDHCLTAGDEAKAEHANDVALEMFGRALAGLPDDDPRRPRVREAVADLLVLDGAFAEAQAHYRAILPDLQREASSLSAGRVMRKIGLVEFESGEIERSEETLWRAVRLLGGAVFARWKWNPGIALRVARGRLVGAQLRRVRGKDASPDDRERHSQLRRAFITLGLINSTACDMRSEALVLESIRHATRTGSVEELSESHALWGGMCATQGRFAPALRVGTLNLEHAEGRGDRRHAAIARSYLAHSYLLMAETPAVVHKALDLARRAADDFRACGDPFELGVAYITASRALLHLGRLREALEWAEEGLGLMARVGSWDNWHLLVETAAHVRSQMGRADQARERLEALETARFTSERMRSGSMASFLYGRGRALLLEGDFRGAVACLEDAERHALAWGRGEASMARVMSPPFVGIYPALARAYLGVDGVESRRRRAVRMALRYASGTGILPAKDGILFPRRYPGIRSPALVAYALARARDGRIERALPAFDESVRVAHAQGAPLLEADALQESARFLAGRDDEEASRRVARARALFDACGAEAGVRRLAGREARLELPGA